MGSALGTRPVELVDARIPAVGKLGDILAKGSLEEDHSLAVVDSRDAEEVGSHVEEEDNHGLVGVAVGNREVEGDIHEVEAGTHEVDSHFHAGVLAY